MSYNKALAFKPNYAEAYYNIGSIMFQDHGKLNEATEAFNKALSLKKDYAEAHLTLSSFKLEDQQFLQVKEIYKRSDLIESDRCCLSFALAKMYDDIGDLDKAFKHLSQGNAFKLLKYSIRTKNCSIN